MGILSSQTYVTFSLAEERFCTNVQNVREVIRPAAYTHLPGAGAVTVGVINVRGKIIPVVDSAVPLLGMRTEDPTRGRIIIATTTHGDVGLLVGEVHGIIELDSGTRTAAPADLTRNDAAVLGLIEHGGHILALIDLDVLIEGAIAESTPALASTTP